MGEVARTVLVTFDWFVLGYFLVLNSSYLVLIVVASLEFSRHVRRTPYSGYDDIFRSPLTPAVSLLVPAHNEQAGIVDSVQAMLALRYPHFEVVVIDDGSTDETFTRLEQTFGLAEVPKVVPRLVETQGEVLSVHVPVNGDALVVIRKTSAGKKTDALNAGINVAQHPLLCMVDADSLLDEEALLRVAKPFVDDPLRMVATGGVIRAANGATVYRGRLQEPRMPPGWLPRIQVVEYLRSFLLGRVGWSKLNGLLVISGAFGLFRRDVVVEAGGLDPTTLGEDAELVTRIHRRMREERRPYRVAFVAEPVCWTEVPATLRVLGRQRRRWARGLVEVVSRHRRMLLNPRYGRIGMVVLPYYVAFEMLGPVIELLGIVSLVVGLAFGLVDWSFAVLFALVAVGYGLLLSTAAVAVEEFTFHRYSSWRDLRLAFAAAVVENFGYRQIHSWWRLQGLWGAIRGGEAKWGTMPRLGFSGADASPPPVGATSLNSKPAVRAGGAPVQSDVG